MLQNVQYPNAVNLTLNLRKAFDITYVRLRFHTSVPESFAIYKQKCETCPWTPLQYYSASCRMTYGVENRDVIRTDNEQKALCTNEFSVSSYCWDIWKAVIVMDEFFVTGYSKKVYRDLDRSEKCGFLHV